MRRILSLLVSLLALVAFTASAALAAVNFASAPQGAHFTRGSGEPVCVLAAATDTASCTGTEFAGVGNTNATVALTLVASATVVCRNPGNARIVEPHTTAVSETTTATVASTKNGRLAIPAQSETITPEDVEAQFTCPNPNWTQDVTDVAVTSFTYTVTFAGFSAPVIALP